MVASDYLDRIQEAKYKSFDGLPGFKKMQKRILIKQSQYAFSPDGKNIEVDLSDEYDELEEIEDEFEELRSLIDEGKFEDLEETFKENILPKYEKLALKAYVAVMDAVANKMIGDTRKTLKKFRKDAKSFDLVLDLKEQEDEIDDFEDRLEQVKVLIRENKTAEADSAFREVEADFKIFWKKGSAKVRLAFSEKGISTWETIISGVESLGLDVADSMNAKLNDIKDIVEEAKQDYEDENYDAATEKLEPLESMFKEIEAMLPKKQESEII